MNARIQPEKASSSENCTEDLASWRSPMPGCGQCQNSGRSWLSGDRHKQRGIAFSLGYPDGQRISRDEMLDVVARIANAVHVP